MGLAESFVEREYHLLNTLEKLRIAGFMKGNDKLVLGGGHGVRAYLPRNLQRFSIDLDFYSNISDFAEMKNSLEKTGFVYRGYGASEGGIYKRYDAPLPEHFRRGTMALTGKYVQHFKIGGVLPEFYATVSNELVIESFVMRRPMSYLPIDYVKEELPILPAEVIIASKIRIISVRPTKDVYKDLFDIHALYKYQRISDEKVIESLRRFGPKISKYEILNRIRTASHEKEAKRAVKLPADGLNILENWGTTTKELRTKIISLLEEAACLT